MTHNISRTDVRHLAGLFSMQEVADLIGMSYRQLYYRVFETKELPRPTIRIGDSRRMHFTAIELGTIKRLMAAE